MRLSGGALGKGLSENVRDAYRWLARHYADGAEIFVFGFSAAPTPHVRCRAS